jgi:ribulose-phosphate 3-epimerase
MRPGTLEKIAAAQSIAARSGYQFSIAVDGGVKPDNTVGLTQAGADILIMGTALFRSMDLAKTIDSIRESVAELSRR